MNDPAPPMTRLFLALWPGPAALRVLADEQARWQWPPGAVIVPADRLHVTLYFIGPVPTSRLAELAQQVDVAFRPCRIVFDHAALWPKGVAVLDASAMPQALTDLHRALQTRLRRLGLPVESRPFKPHVTLARKAMGAALPDKPPRLHWWVRGYALVQSQAGYRTLARYA